MTEKIVLTKEQLTKILHCATGHVRDFVMDNNGFIDEQLKAINYTPCCMAESEQLPTYDVKDLNQLVDEYKNKVMNLDTLLESIWDKAYVEGMLYERIYNK